MLPRRKINFLSYLIVMEVISLVRKMKNSATAFVYGSKSYPELRGKVMFQQLQSGVLVTAQVTGLPHKNDPCSSGVFGFHIHEGSDCTGTDADPFANVGSHYNPGGCPHPHHAGDMPPLFENDGFAYLSFLTDRFTVKEIIGKTVIIHSAPDDFTTQPSGNSGQKIACGRIGA